MRLLIEKLSSPGHAPDAPDAPNPPGALHARLIDAETSQPFAVVINDNPFADFKAILDAESSPIVCWSGTCADELFAADPRNWMQAGRDRFQQFIVSVIKHTPEDHRIIIRPHARHVLSDVPSTLTFLRGRDDQAKERIGIALSPVTMLEPSMLTMLNDHLARMFETLGPVCDLVCMTDARPSRDDDDSIELCPLGSGVLPQELCRTLIAQHVPDDTPIAILDDDLEAQRAWLGV